MTRRYSGDSFSAMEMEWSELHHYTDLWNRIHMETIVRLSFVSLSNRCIFFCMLINKTVHVSISVSLHCSGVVMIRVGIAYPLGREHKVNLLLGRARIFVYYIKYINVCAAIFWPIESSAQITRIVPGQGDSHTLITSCTFYPYYAWYTLSPLTKTPNKLIRH